jgi:sarcosine oxidase subunit gamma
VTTAADGLRARSPLGGVAKGVTKGVALPGRVRELPFLAQLDVRADPGDAALLGRLASVLSTALPVEPNTTATSTDGTRLIVWLGPDEWLVIGEPGTGPALEAEIRAALEAGDPPTSGTSAVVDVSANRTTVSVAGPRARDLLAFGCSIDLDARSFGPGRCAQTMLARAQVIIVPVGPEAEPAFRILVRPSFASYLAAWLADAAVGLD